jgi:hypothetical protein
VTLGAARVTAVTTGIEDPGLPQPQHRVLVPGLTLLADDPGPSSVAPGDHLPVTLLWQASAALSALQGTLVLRESDGTVIAQSAGPVGGTYPTEQWPIGGVVREQRTLDLPASAPGGVAHLAFDLAHGPTVPLGTVSINRVVRDFQAPTVAHELPATFGSAIGLLGYDLSSTRLHPSDSLTVTLDWHSLQATRVSYHVFVHLLDAKNHIWAQWDGVPRNWSYPTSAWLPGEYVVDHYPLTVSPQAPPGPYTVEVGLYDATTGQRLAVTAAPGGPAADRVVLPPVQVIAR